MNPQRRAMWRGHGALLAQSLENPAGFPTCPPHNGYDGAALAVLEIHPLDEQDVTGWSDDGGPGNFEVPTGWVHGVKSGEATGYCRVTFSAESIGPAVPIVAQQE
jgi:hypothetical protein